LEKEKKKKKGSGVLLVKEIESLVKHIVDNVENFITEELRVQIKSTKNGLTLTLILRGIQNRRHEQQSSGGGGGNAAEEHDILRPRMMVILLCDILSIFVSASWYRLRDGDSSNGTIFSSTFAGLGLKVSSL